jgi:4-hydroxybenzoate polyprenyltransferase
MSEAMTLQRTARWGAFIHERFPLASHLPMVAVFFAVNSYVGLTAAGQEPYGLLLFGAALVTLLFFFRLRMFDEIKDYEVDLAVNPTRPLARGLLSLSEVKRAILISAIVELVLVLPAGVHALTAYAAAMAYSFLMYREFFIGRQLRPHLTTYAVSHTFVSILLGLALASYVTSESWWSELPIQVPLFGIVNWMFFNLFEFARKTFAPSEERESVESYSKIFRPLGAALLSISQVAIAIAILKYTSLETWIYPRIELSLIGTGSLVVLTGLYFAFYPVTRSAKLFRGMSGFCIILFYATLALNFGLQAYGIGDLYAR